MRAALFFAGAAMMSSAMGTTLYGGGSTLPVGAYFGWNAPNRLILPADVDASSIFGAWAGASNHVQYCQTGSGNGKRVINGDTSGSPSLTATGICDNNLLLLTGFSVPTTAVVQPDFIDSGVPYWSAEYATFIANKGTARGEPVQFPAIAASIAIVYNNSSLSSQLNLTQAQVCGIFAGTITNWHDLNSAFMSKAIKVVYRADDSGSTFNFSNYLTAVCGIIGGGHFQTSQNFFSPASGSVIALVPLNTATSKIGANGDANVIVAVNATDGTIGYAGTGDALDHSGIGINPVGHATIDGKDPVTDFPATFPVTVLYDRVIVSASPTVMLGTQTPNSTANCLGIVDPNTYAIQPSTRYPIVAVTYLIANQKGNSTDLTALRSFMIYAQNHAIVEPGFAQLTGTGISTPKALSCLAA
ncbi:substrate-binding domain-containing protein [Dyella sp. GSA-30]|uniref:PstS family phosphate ABC transporter substrate-binding protein n=1 Tax=Dyella sp. GSA-30 TaxID=2994496 RepID=UPI00248FBB66|nr:substrate-binding domain-containing protein [Dyella sp. GSA-30]BDU23178.1 hypothetical protein DYGSA30_46350 [Dyella sp. GSA-30]